MSRPFPAKPQRETHLSHPILTSLGLSALPQKHHMSLSNPSLTLPPTAHPPKLFFQSLSPSARVHPFSISNPISPSPQSSPTLSHLQNLTHSIIPHSLFILTASHSSQSFSTFLSHTFILQLHSPTLPSPQISLTFPIFKAPHLPHLPAPQPFPPSHLSP